MAEQLRPDKSKVVLAYSPDGKSIIGHCDPGYPMAWHEGAIGAFLIAQRKKGLDVIINNGPCFFEVQKDGTARELIMTAPDANGVQLFAGYKLAVGT